MFTISRAVFVGALACGLVLAAGETQLAQGQPKEKPAEPYINPKTKKDVAEEQLAKLGARVKRDTSRPGHPVVEIKLYGENVTDTDLKDLATFTDLRHLEIYSRKVTGEGFSALAKLPLEYLWLNSPNKALNDAGFKELAKLTSLKTLRLPQGEFTDAGVKELTALTNLEDLIVSFGVSDDALAHVLKSLKKLRRLQADNSYVGDGAMKVLSELPEVRVVELYGSAVTDAGYVHIGKMAKLEELRTSYKITDKGLAELGGLKNLKKLNLWNSSVTVKGVRALPNLKNLKEIDVSSWNIKPEEAKQLGADLPNCKVNYSK